MDNQENDFFDDVDTDIKPPKKQLSEQAKITTFIKYTCQST